MPYSIFIDLAMPGAKLAVEVDGSTHKLTKVKESDARKTAYLASLGWTVLRFWNAEILSSTDSVVAQIKSAFMTSG